MSYTPYSTQFYWGKYGAPLIPPGSSTRPSGFVHKGRVQVTSSPAWQQKQLREAALSEL